MTNTLVKYQVPMTPEWDKAMHAQREAELLEKFFVFLQFNIGCVEMGWSVEPIIAKFYNIDLNKLADEQEEWAEFDAFIQKELGLNE
jgi:hypothetical protein